MPETVTCDVVILFMWWLMHISNCNYVGHDFIPIILFNHCFLVQQAYKYSSKIERESFGVFKQVTNGLFQRELKDWYNISNYMEVRKILLLLTWMWCSCFHTWKNSFLIFLCPSIWIYNYLSELLNKKMK